MISKIHKVIILQFFLLSCTKQYVQQKHEFKHYTLKETEAKKQTNDAFAAYKLKVEAETGRVIANSADEITKDGSETTLGNFVCDALIYTAGSKFKNEPIDLVIVNRGGLRTNLPKGDIKVENIFELMPFENEMVLVTVTGENFLKALPLILEKKHPFSGLKMKIENGKITSVKLNGLEIDETRLYNVITSDYLANGGDNFTFLKDPKKLKNSDLRIRDAIINYCEHLTKNQKQIIPYKDGRLEISK